MMMMIMMMMFSGVDRQMDGQTDKHLATALPALCIRVAR